MTEGATKFQNDLAVSTDSMSQGIPEITPEQVKNARLVCAGIISNPKHLSVVLRALGLMEVEACG